MARVLVVDDDSAIRHILTVVLLAAGYMVPEAANGREALAMLPTFAPHLVLLDLHMPVMDGFRFLRELPSVTADPPYVLVLSANTPDSTDAPEVTLHEAVEKPFVIEDVLGRVERLVRRRLAR
jgi:DNA-binding response OmpR family regulator